MEWRDKSWRITAVGQEGQRLVADLVAAQAAEAEAAGDAPAADGQ